MVSVGSKRAVSGSSMLEKKGMKDSRESLLTLHRRHLQVSKTHSKGRLYPPRSTPQGQASPSHGAAPDGPSTEAADSRCSVDAELRLGRRSLQPPWAKPCLPPVDPRSAIAIGQVPLRSCASRALPATRLGRPADTRS